MPKWVFVGVHIILSNLRDLSFEILQFWILFYNITYIIVMIFICIRKIMSWSYLLKLCFIIVCIVQKITDLLKKFQLVLINIVLLIYPLYYDLAEKFLFIKKIDKFSINPKLAGQPISSDFWFL